MNPQQPDPISNPMDNLREEDPNTLDPNDADALRNRIHGQTTQHAAPPRLEDEGQSGG